MQLDFKGPLAHQEPPGHLDLKDQVAHEVPLGHLGQVALMVLLV